MRDERTPKDVCGEAKLNCLKKKIMQTKSDQKKYSYRRRVNLQGMLNVERNYDRMCGTVDPATKNLNFKNLLG